MIDYNTFRQKVEHNSDVLKSAIASGKKLITILSDLHTLEHEPGELHTTVLMRNAHDILPSAYLGVLANIDANGIDAYKINPDGTHIGYELKTGEIDGRLVWQGPRGGLMLGDPTCKNRTIAVTSAINAKYKIYSNENRESKNINTALFISDISGPDGYFDAWELDGETVMSYIKGREGRLDIKLGSFMNYGKQATTVVPLRGYSDWKYEKNMKAPVYRIIY